MKRGRKSNAIRAVIAENPNATPKEIAAKLKARRVKVSTSLISRVKYAKGRRKVTTNGQVTMDGLLAAKALVAKLGSVEAARQSLDALAKLL